MCGRYGLFTSKKQLKEHYQLVEEFSDVHQRYNIPPGSVMPVIINKTGINQLLFMKWGLVPSWAKDETIGYKMINARVETLQEKSSFKNLLPSNRCLIPSSGYFEWKHEENTKQPFFIKVKEIDLMSFAGLYSQWKKSDGNILHTYTIITTSAISSLENIHNRMPVVLSKQLESAWLSTENKIDFLFREVFRQKINFEFYPVSLNMNNPSWDNESVIKKIY
jgi:putative SOS response-associated peptidase YedK